MRGFNLFVDEVALNSPHPATDPPTYHQLEVNVRPPRAVALIPGNGSWLPQAQRMIENFSGVWGGSGDVLLPVDGDSNVHKALLSLIGRFDPDRFGFYVA